MQRGPRDAWMRRGSRDRCYVGKAGKRIRIDRAQSLAKCCLPTWSIGRSLFSSAAHDQRGRTHGDSILNRTGAGLPVAFDRAHPRIEGEIGRRDRGAGTSRAAMPR